MSDTPSRASAVIIGAGIVGNSLAHHLALLGWRDLVLVDKGPMPNPGGSTGHASNFIFPIEYSKMMFELTRDSTEQYQELGVLTQSGGIEVARTPERMIELRRRCSMARAWGIPASVITPAEVRKLVPYLDDSVILGGGYFPTVGVVDSLRAGTLMRERAVSSGALTVLANTEVLGIDVVDGTVRAVITGAGRIETDNVVICCGVWSPRIARMAGARMALTPCVHQMISVGPVALFADTPGEISYPIVRDVDTNMYERQHGGDMEVGSYAHRPILVRPDDIPSIEESALSPTELPFTQDDFDPQLAEALELMPELLGDEKAGIRYAINGLISMTPDGHPILGEMPEARGLWSAAASWIKEGPGCGRAVAELMSGKVPTVDVFEANAARFWPHQTSVEHVAARANEAFNKMYGIVHPAEQWASVRPQRVSPMYERERDLGAVFYETAGWERPFWYESNSGLLEKYAEGQLMDRPAEWESRWWSPIINAEHLAMRETCALVDLSAFAVLDVSGPGALATMQRLAVAQLDVPAGRVVYTSFLDQNGGFVADLTVMRLAHDRFRVVTGGATGRSDFKWISDHRLGDTSIVDVTGGWTTLGLWGPNARAVLAAVTSADVSHEGFAFGTGREIEIGSTVVLASRISYVGELGWELYVPIEQGARVWDALWAAGQPHGLIPAGIGVYGTTGRLEKGYRAFGAELTQDYTLVEAGMTRPKVKPQSFIGKDAYLRQRDEQPCAILCTLTVDSCTSSDGTPRYMLGKEPILSLSGERLVDAKGRPSYVTSAGSGPSVGKHLLMAYLPVSEAVEGRSLLVEYMSERFPVTVARASSVPLFDLDNSRIRS
jgi:glycine cleavage system aminomethyltransferase T/glycine/D-amino acid oxidase-like deaminating enzyme